MTQVSFFFDQLIAEAWDCGGLYQVGSFPHWGIWSEWNGKVRVNTVLSLDVQSSESFCQYPCSSYTFYLCFCLAMMNW